MKGFKIEFSGGIRTEFPPEMLPVNALAAAVNLEYDASGRLVSRGGQTAFNASAIAGTLDNGTRFYRETTGVIKTLV